MFSVIGILGVLAIILYILFSLPKAIMGLGKILYVIVLITSKLTFGITSFVICRFVDLATLTPANRKAFNKLKAQRDLEEQNKKDPYYRTNQLRKNEAALRKLVALEFNYPLADANLFNEYTNHVRRGEYDKLDDNEKRIKEAHNAVFGEKNPFSDKQLLNIGDVIDIPPIFSEKKGNVTADIIEKDDVFIILAKNGVHHSMKMFQTLSYWHAKKKLEYAYRQTAHYTNTLTVSNEWLQ